jgi:hypothetical protein
VIFGLPLVASRDARTIIRGVPQPLLIAVQTYRLLGGVFLILMVQDRMPPAFALPAGWGGVVIGALARRLRPRPGERPSGRVRWSSCGTCLESSISSSLSRWGC